MRGKRVKALKRNKFDVLSKREFRRLKREWSLGWPFPAPKPLKLRKSKQAQPPVFGVFHRHHPLREVGKFFDELSDKGKGIAVNLKFGRARVRGSFASLTRYPRGLPGTGRASRLPRHALVAEIRGLRNYIGVQQYV